MSRRLGEASTFILDELDIGWLLQDKLSLSAFNYIRPTLPSAREESRRTEGKEGMFLIGTR